MPKFLIALLVAFVLCSCTSSRIKTVFLHPVEETGSVMSSVALILSPRQPQDKEVELAKLMELDSFLVFEVDHKPGKKEVPATIVTGEKMMLPPVDLLDARTIIMAGYKSGEIYLLADENNNNTLEDDEAVKADPSLLRTQSYKDFTGIPFFRIHGLKTILDGREIFFKKSFYVLPDTIRDGSLNLVLLSNEQKEGSFRYRKKQYTIRARQSVSYAFQPGGNRAMLRIDSLKCPTGAPLDETRMGHVLDTLTAGSTRFVVTSMSTFLEQAEIVAVRAPRAKKQKAAKK